MTEQGFDWAGLQALKSTVTLEEAQLAEAVMCERGDRRYEFQNFYRVYSEKIEKQKQRSASNAHLGELDSEAVREELADMRRAIAENEELLEQHREAVLDDLPSPLRPEDVDATEATIAALRANIPFIEATLAELDAAQAGNDESSRLVRATSSVVVNELEPLDHVGPVQSGTLRKRGRRG